MVLVASSRSASTELPSEQNHPGRRLEHAAQPIGEVRFTALRRDGITVIRCTSAIVAFTPAGEAFLWIVPFPEGRNAI